MIGRVRANINEKTDRTNLAIAQSLHPQRGSQKGVASELLAGNFAYEIPVVTNADFKYLKKSNNSTPSIL